jgi:hydrogenase-4 component F
MILLLLIFPLVLCLILWLIQSRALNIYANFIYSVVYLAAVILLYFHPSVFTDFFKVDSMNILFLLSLALLYFGVSIYNIDFLKKSDAANKSHTYYAMFFLLFVFSMTGAILSTHLALLWVFVEATTLFSSYLIYFNKTNASLEAAWKYIFICSIGIALAFVGIILLSLGMGTINSLFFNDLYKNAGLINPFWLKLSFVFILVGLGTKMGLAPVHAWLPDAHSEAPSPVSAMLSGTLLNTALLGIIRMVKLLNLAGIGYYAKILLLLMGFLSLFVCAVYIVRMNNYKRMLAYSSIENMGIIAIGFGIGGIGVFAALLHMIAHSLTKASLFLTAGNILHQFKTKKISEVRGLFKSSPVTGWLWAFSFIAIAGIPPFPIFLSEFLTAKALFQNGQIVLVIIYFLLLTIVLAGMGSSVFRMCWGASIETSKTEGLKSYRKLELLTLLSPIFFLFLLLIMGLGIPGFLYQLLNEAAQSME